MASIQTISLLVTSPNGTLVNVRALDYGLNGAQTGAQLLSVIDARYHFNLWGRVTADGDGWNTVVFESLIPTNTRLTVEAQLDADLGQWRTSGGGRFTVHVTPPLQTAGHTGPAAAPIPGPHHAWGPWDAEPSRKPRGPGDTEPSRKPSVPRTLAQMRGMLGVAQV